LTSFLSKFNTEHKEIAKKLYHCELNEDIPHPPLISQMMEKFTLWKALLKSKRVKPTKSLLPVKKMTLLKTKNEELIFYFIEIS
jgi:hypothetical protein